MAAQRKKRLDKVAEPAVPDFHVNFYCCRCGTAYNRQKGYFPVSHSPMYRGSGYLPICATCVDDLYQQYRIKLGSDRAAMYRMCMKLDLYWSDALYEAVEKSSGTSSRVRAYIGKTNLIHYVGKSFDDTINEEIRARAEAGVEDGTPLDEVEVEVEEETTKEIRIPKRVINFWGDGYEPQFYLELERRYKNWTNGEEITEPSVRSLYQQICILEATIARDSAAGKSIDKHVNALNTLLKSMNLTPSQASDDIDADLENMPLGVGIQKWEFDRPLPATPEDQKDVNRNIKNITTWFLGHACKMVGLRNSYCRLYEEAMEQLRVDHPEYDEEDDDVLLDNIFGSSAQAPDGGDA